MRKKMSGVGSTAMMMVMLAGILPGCSGESDARRAVRKATQDLDNLTAGGSALTSDLNAQLAGLKSIRDTLNPAKDSTEPGVTGPANQLLARTLSQMASIELTRAGKHATAASEKLAAASREAGQYAASAARAAASEKVDLSAELAKLAQQKTRQQDDLAKVSAELSANQAQQTKLDREAAGLMDQSKALRKQATELQATLANISATEGLAVVKQSAEITRRADAFERQSAEVAARAGEWKGKVDDAQRIKAAAERNIKLIDDTAKSVTARQGQAREVAGEGKVEADKHAAAFAAALDAAEKVREGDLATALASAEKLAREALAASKKAGSDSAAKLGIATYQQQLGEVLMTKAQQQIVYAGVTTSVAKLKPAVPNGTALADKATKAAEEAKSQLEAARAAYKEAKDIFEGAGSSLPDTSKQTLERLQLQLTTLADDRAAAAVKAPEPGAVEAAAPAGENAGIVAAVKARIDESNAAVRAKDWAKAASFVDAQGEARAAVDQLLEIVGSANKLDEACKAKFGKPFAELLGPMGAGLGKITKGPLEEAKFSGEDYTLVVESPTKVVASLKPDKAIEGLPNTPTTWILKGSIWLMQLPPEMASGPGLKMLNSIAPIGKVYNDLAADVAAGKFPTEQAFQTAMQMKLAPIMMEMMKGMNDPQK